MSRWLSKPTRAGLLLLSISQGCANSEAGTGFETTATEAPDGGAGDASVAPPPPTTTCVHNDDCKAADLCVGTNGVACVGGFCTATGKPMNCDDGVACTNDACDANKNACVHVPNDAACPTGSYCDAKTNCVQTLPCTPGSDICDRLNTTACDGLFSCDAVKKYCVRAPKPCADRPNAATSCVASGTNATCSWGCNATYVDLDSDLNSATTSNGCECVVTNATDTPTLANVDGNCDGIVGNITKAIFVDTITGNDGNAGTKASPKKTIQGGISAAAAAVPTKDVYVSKGTYNETVTLADGIGVYGGYDAAANWSRSNNNATNINSAMLVGVSATSLTKPTEIQLLRITSADANGTASNGDGLSSIGVRIAGSTGVVTVRGCVINAGAGYPGGSGGSGTTGGTGSIGGNASGTTLGGGGGGCGGANGGPGGPAVSGETPGQAGNQGFSAPGGGSPALGGGGGSAGGCNITSSSNGGAAPPVAANGNAGGAGTNGSVGGTFGFFSAVGAYTPATGGDGLTPGLPGGGGGGGGSGGGTASGTNFICSNCSGIASGAGGGGGGGGCGGAIGRGGRGGGGSFGIAAVASQVVVDSTRVVTKQGGNGGGGGSGGQGGGGGPGGQGAAGQNRNNSCNNRSGGPGADGSGGGSGGRGGGGAGGTGGPSVCIVYKGISPTTSANQCVTGGGGTGGNGGSNGLANAPKGQDGVADDLRSSP